MKRATGIGGIFFKAKDPAKLLEWYRVHLGIEAGSWIRRATVSNFGNRRRPRSKQPSREPHSRSEFRL